MKYIQSVISNKSKLMRNAFILFLCIQPLLDLDILYSEEIVNIFNFSPSTIIRLVMVFLLFIILFISNRKMKKSKQIVIYSLITILYCSFHYINSRFFFIANKTGTFNFSTANEIFYLIRMFVPIIIIYITSCFKFSYKHIKTIFKTVIALFSITIVLSSIFKFGLMTYGTEKITTSILDIFSNKVFDPYTFATRGIFEGTNRIGILLTALLPINLYFYIVDNKKSDFVLVLTHIISLILVGTRVASYCWIFVIIMVAIVYMFSKILKREKPNIMKFMGLFVIFAIGIILVIESPMNERKVSNDYISDAKETYEKENLGDKLTNRIEEINKLPDKVPNQEPGKEDEKEENTEENEAENQIYDKNQLKQEFIKENYNKYYIQNAYIEQIYNYKYDEDFWLEVMKIPFEQRSSGRDLQKLISDRILELNSNELDPYLGMGYSRFRNAGLYLEKDIFVHLYTIGIIGTLLFIIIPYSYPLIRYCIYLFKNFKNRFDLETIIYCSSICLFILLAIISGHVLCEMITYTFIAFICGLILNKTKEETKEIDKKESVSIIVPIYNCEEYLEECLDSIVNQTYGIDNLDVILVNDCSKDNSLKIAKEYSDKYGFRLIENKSNMGLANTRNKAIDTAKGKYICFLDSDDILYTNAIEILYRKIVETNSDIVISKLNSFNSKGKYGYYSDKYMECEKEGNIKEHFDLMNCVSVCSKLYKKDFIKNNKLKFLKNTYHEDISFTTIAFYKAKKISVVNEYSYYRRVREDNSSIMQNLNMNTFNDVIKNYEYALKTLNKRNDIRLNILILRKLGNYIVNNIDKEKYTESEDIVNKFINKNFKYEKFYKLIFKYYFKFVKFINKIRRKEKNSDKKKKVMFISSVGGHLTQLLQISSIFEKYNYVLITEKTDVTKNMIDKYNISFLPYGSRNQKYIYPFILISNCFMSLFYFIKYNPDVIITTGANTAAAMCCIGKIFRKKVIYIESFAKRNTPTMTGKYIYKLHAYTTFVVQWESMLEYYKDAEYWGGIY